MNVDTHVFSAPKQELEADKSLEEQYDFEIKPYVIHLQ